jgi:hypothetical protein
MKRQLLIIILLLQTSLLVSQNTEIIVNDSSQYGFNRPRLALLNNNIPFVLWGKPGVNSKVFGAKLVGSNFTPPVQIAPDSMNPRVGTTDGPNIVAHNDSIYVVWGNQSPANHHVFMNRSTDAGNSFGPAIQTDSITPGDNIEYPGVSISNNGILGIYFLKSDASWNNTRQSLITSLDRGLSFSKDSAVNTFAPGVPCECCQGSMEMQDSNWVFYYRNNVADIRNSYSLVSTNTGASFNEAYEMDIVDWFIQSCPSSGPEGHINGSKSFTSWMSKATGSSRILYATVDISLQTVSPATYIDTNVAASVIQNYPSVDGEGDTVAIIWQDNRYMFSHIFTSISIDGGQNFTETILLSDTTVLGSYSAGDVAYANGIFHFVWKGSNKIYYKSASLSNLLSISDNSSMASKINLYPNPASTILTIDTDLKIQKIKIIDITGKNVKSFTPKTNAINVSDLPDSIYFIKIFGEEDTITQKFVKN